jgi:hypothetical protein
MNDQYMNYHMNNHMDNRGGDVDEVRQLVRVLGLANENSLMHDKANADLEETDLLLENAAIRLSSRIAYEITRGSCRSASAAPETLADRSCVLDDETIGLRGLTDMLSYAAYRLQRLGTSAAANASDNRRGLVAARIRSIEHLYRMVFALSKSYLDRPQGAVYLEAAHHQLRLAREQMEIESGLCDCSSSGYATRLTELSQLDDRLAEFEAETIRR